MIVPWEERPVNFELQRLRRSVIADQLASRGWSRTSAKFDSVVNAKLRKVRHLSHCRYDNDIDPLKLKKAHDDYRTAMERKQRIFLGNQARKPRHG